MYVTSRGRTSLINKSHEGAAHETHGCMGCSLHCIWLTVGIPCLHFINLTPGKSDIDRINATGMYVLFTCFTLPLSLVHLPVTPPIKSPISSTMCHDRRSPQAKSNPIKDSLVQFEIDVQNAGRTSPLKTITLAFLHSLHLDRNVVLFNAPCDVRLENKARRQYTQQWIFNQGLYSRRRGVAK